MMVMLMTMVMLMIMTMIVKTLLALFQTFKPVQLTGITNHRGANNMMMVMTIMMTTKRSTLSRHTAQAQASLTTEVQSHSKVKQRDRQALSQSPSSPSSSPSSSPPSSSLSKHEENDLQVLFFTSSQPLKKVV